MSSPTRDQQGRFAGAPPLHELLDGLADVARTAAANTDPCAISKDAWNRARIELARFDLPTAEGARKRVGLDWPLTLELALRPVEERGRFLGGRRRRPTIFQGERELAIAGLRAVALRLGCSPNVLAYDTEVVRLEGERVRRGRTPLGLPHSKTIERLFRSWAAGLEAAGLDPLPVSEPPRRRAERAAAILDRCIDETGILPSRTWFEAWCRATDTPLGRDGREWEHVIAEARALRTSRRESTPSAPPPNRAAYPPLPTPPPGANRRSRKRYTDEDVLASLRLYGERYLEPGRPARFKRYQSVAPADPGLVPASTVQRHGRFQELCRKAGI